MLNQAFNKAKKGVFRVVSGNKSGNSKKRQNPVTTFVTTDPARKKVIHRLKCCSKACILSVTTVTTL
jgi:hypothetical protein